MRRLLMISAFALLPAIGLADTRTPFEDAVYVVPVGGSVGGSCGDYSGFCLYTDSSGRHYHYIGGTTYSFADTNPFTYAIKGYKVLLVAGDPNEDNVYTYYPNPGQVQWGPKNAVNPGGGGLGG